MRTRGVAVDLEAHLGERRGGGHAVRQQARSTCERFAELLRGCPEVLDGLDEREVFRVLEFVELVGGALEEARQTVDLGRDEGIEQPQRVDDGEERVAELPNRLEQVGRVLELVELKLIDFERAIQRGAVRL